MTGISGGTRRRLVFASSAALGLLLAGCDNERSSAGAPDLDPKEVTADEDLMREHGVLRRCVLVYAQCAVRLRRDPRSVPADALHDAAMLFRRFGEDYHEKLLEERFVFPEVRRSGSVGARYIDTLITQHNRGREITDFVLRVTAAGQVAAAAPALAVSLSSFAWMYENHASREDTIVFPDWKAALSGEQYQERAVQFQRLEDQLLGEEGFRQAVARIAAIEQELGMADLAQFTAPPPPRA